MTKTKEQVAERTIGVMMDVVKLDRNQYAESAKLQEDLGYDSLDLVEMTYKVEEAFGLDITDEKVEKVRTVGDVVDLICAELHIS